MLRLTPVARGGAVITLAAALAACSGSSSSGGGGTAATTAPVTSTPTTATPPATPQPPTPPPSPPRLPTTALPVTAVTPSTASSDVFTSIEITGTGFSAPLFVELTNGNIVVMQEAVQVTATTAQVPLPAMTPPGTYELRVGLGTMPTSPYPLNGPSLTFTVTAFPTTNGQGELLYPRSNHASVALPSGEVLVVGGLEAGGGALAPMELYDPATDTSQVTQRMWRPLVDPELTLLDNGAVVIHGGDLQARGAPRGWGLGSAPREGVLFQGPALPQVPFSLPADLVGYTLTGIGGQRALLCGGEFRSGGANTQAWLADFGVAPRGFAINGFTPLPAPPTQRVGAKALLRYNAVLVMGGRDPVTGNALTSVDLFDTTTQTWQQLYDTMTTPRADGYAVLTRGYRDVLMVGGQAAGGTFMDTWWGPGYTWRGEVYTPPFAGFFAVAPIDQEEIVAVGAGGGQDVYWSGRYLGAPQGASLQQPRDGSGTFTVTEAGQDRAVVIGGNWGGAPLSDIETVIHPYYAPAPSAPTPPVPPVSPPPSSPPVSTPPPTIYGRPIGGGTPQDVTFYGETVTSQNAQVTYVLDRSCSMGWNVASYTTPSGTVATGHKLDRVKAELVRSIMNLPAGMRFNIVAFDCGTMQWSSSAQLADNNAKQAAIGWVNSINPGGATGTGPAVSVALQDRDNDVILLLTGSGPNCGASGANGHRSMIRAQNTQGAQVYVFGSAMSGSYRAFGQGVASDSGAYYFDMP